MTTESSRGPAEPAQASISIDLSEKLRRHARVRIGWFCVVIALGVVALVAGLESPLGDEAWVPIAAAGFILVLVLSLVLSVRRFSSRLGARSELTIERTGVTWRGVHDFAQLTWDDLAGVGISYYQSMTEESRKKRMPQLDIFEQVSSPPGRWPELDRRRRAGRPPVPQLPAQRYRLMLPPDDQVYRMIEEAVRAYRPQLWLGWYRRSDSDTPLLLH